MIPVGIRLDPVGFMVSRPPYWCPGPLNVADFFSKTLQKNVFNINLKRLGHGVGHGWRAGVCVLW